MVIRPNRFNDPALGEAFGNIASIFAPPSAQDTLAYTGAQAKRQEADRLSWLFENATDPLADRKAVMAGVYNPTQSFYAQDQNNATAQRGQDVTANTALQANLTDNRFGLAKQYMAPRAQGVVDPGLPSDLAQFFGAPEMAPVNGAPKPLSETEQLAAERQALAASGAFTPDMQLEQILGGETPVKIAGPDGQPVFSTPGAAARAGAAAYIDTGSKAAPDVQNYRSPDGQVGTAVFDEGKGWVDTQTRQPIAPGSQTIKATATGTADDALGPRPANLARAKAIEADVTSMNSLVGELEQTIQSTAGAAGLAASIQSFFQDAQQVTKELSMAAGSDPNSPVTPEAMQAMSEAILGRGGNYDPTFRRVHAMLLDLAYMNARLNNPSGEVSRFALEREMGALGQGITGNDQSVLASTSVARQRMARALDQADVLAGRAAAPTREAVLGGVGSAAPPAAAGGELPVVKTPEDAAKLPSGTKFQTPDGRVKVVP